MTDFNQIVCDLNDAGLSDREISRQVRCTQPTISRMKGELPVEPKYFLGVALVRLHRKMMRRQRNAA